MPKVAPYRIALVAHSPNIVECVRQVAVEGEYELVSRLADFETAAPVARECLENGAEVVLCHGGTGNSIVREVGHSVVAIDRTDMDLIKTLRHAAQVDRNIILAAYAGEEHDLSVIEELLDVRIHHIEYASSKPLFTAVDELYAAGVRVLVGGGITKRYMDDLGGTGFVIAPNRYSIQQALDQAVILARQKRRAVAQHENLLAVFRQLEDGVVCIDAAGSPVFINRKASQLLKIPSDGSGASSRAMFKSLHLLGVLEDAQPRNDTLVELEGEQLVVTALPVIIHQGAPGAVALFRDVPSLQKINRKIGEELYAKGFISRYDTADIIGESPAVRELRAKIARFAPTGAAVLICGETGTGKELAAHALHAQSERADKPFVAVNFAALPENLLESELFGYEDGAFTGARKGGKAGLFELASKGTLFLDEVGEISHEMQLRLLRVLEAKEVMRVGGSRFLPVDVRIVSASHRPLLDLVAEGRFRLDLYHRLATLKLFVPPLRERPDDIPLLLQRLLRQYTKAPAVLSPAVIAILRGYHWPGNVRELLAVMESYCILLEGDTADPELLRTILRENTMPERPGAAAANRYQPERTLRENLLHARRSIIEDAIRFHNGDKKAAAEALDVNYSTLWRGARRGAR